MNSGCSAARLARHVRDVEAGGSNPLTPTIMVKKPYFVYILFSDLTSKYYVGSTENIAARFNYHNRGYNRSTKHGVPWEMIKTIEVNNRSEALKLEFKIKKRGIKRFL